MKTPANVQSTPVPIVPPVANEALNGSRRAALNRLMLVLLAACSGGDGDSAQAPPMLPAPGPGPAPGPAPPGPVSGAAAFPLRAEAGKRHLVDANGNPFFLHGDTAWSLEVQLTDSEIDHYIDDRAERGFNLILIEMIEHAFSSQTPAYRNVSGHDPFETMSDFGSGLNDAYWARVDHIVNRCKDKGMAVMANPAYLGFEGGDQGWTAEINAESDADLQLYGRRLAQRYTQGNVIWCLGGDYDGNAALRVKQWNIVTGIRSVRTTDIVTVHGDVNTNSADLWASLPGFNLNAVYPRFNPVHSLVKAAYDRTPVLPCFFFEGAYENDQGSASQQRIRLQCYQSILNGACGSIYGNYPIWGFEQTNYDWHPWTGSWESHLNDPGAQHMTIAKIFFTSFEWWKLEPRVDTSLVRSNLRTGDERVCPSCASDGSFAMVYVPSGQTVTIDKSSLSISSIRIDLFNPITGATTNHTASTSNTGTVNVTTGGERVIVLRAA